MNKIVHKPYRRRLLVFFSASVAANETLTVGATPVPHAEILEFVKPELARQGVDLKSKVFNDFIQLPTNSWRRKPRRQLLSVPSVPR